MTTVLVVEDDRKLRDLLRAYLERAGWSVLSTASGAEALALAESADPDLVVLDLGLPDMPGELVAAELARARRMPVLMLTCRAEEADRLRGFELGADDYVTKPFSPREVVLRIEAILRRISARDAGPPADGLQRFGDGHLVLDPARREARVAGRGVPLTATEWGLLWALSRSGGKVCSRAELVNRIRGEEVDANDRSIDSHVKNLRRKVETDPRTPQIVLTVSGGGYRLGLDADG
ncbi:MAG TPA: response regulator transcription factor [Sporichthyaceae bacterium]